MMLRDSIRDRGCEYVCLSVCVSVCLSVCLCVCVCVCVEGRVGGKKALKGEGRRVSKITKFQGTYFLNGPKFFIFCIFFVSLIKNEQET